MATALLLSMAACDSAATIDPPTLNGIQSNSELLMFLPGEPLPAAAFTVDAPQEDDVTFLWEASGGTFESTGTAQGAEGRTVSWQPDPVGGTYVIRVQAVRDDLTVTDSTSIDVQPRAFGNWRGTIDLTGETYDWAEFCMFVATDERLSQYSYMERSLDGGDGRGSAGGILDEHQNYDYPTLTATLSEPDSDDFDEPVGLTGTIAASGTSFEIDLEMESGATRSFVVARTATFCQ